MAGNPTIVVIVLALFAVAAAGAVFMLWFLIRSLRRKDRGARAGGQRKF